MADMASSDFTFSPVGALAKSSQKAPSRKPTANSVNSSGIDRSPQTKNSFQYKNIIADTGDDEDIEIDLSPVKSTFSDSSSPDELKRQTTGEHIPKQLPRTMKWFAVYCGVLALTVIIHIAIAATMGQRDDVTENKGHFSTNNPWAPFHADSTQGLGVVATDNEICSNIGSEVLEKGGNSMDAAVASALCLGVLSPASSGLGGGCFIVTHNATTGYNEFIDSREYAPKEAQPSMFESNPIEAQDGGKAIAVLAELKGLRLAWERHGSGKIEWKDLVSPSAELAKEFVISAELGSYIPKVKAQLLSGDFPQLSALYLRSDGSLKVAGDTVENVQLSQTLNLIGLYGSDYIYEQMATDLAGEIQNAGGIITVNDIRHYHPKIYTALTTEFMGYTYIGARGSSSGGAVVAGIVKYLSSFSEPLVSLGALYHHRLVEAMKHCFAIRQSLGDPDFVNITGPVSALLSDSYMRALQLNSSDSKVLPLLQYGGDYNYQRAATKDAGTSHLSVLDRYGNAVAITSTINTYFGSKVLSTSTGILFNNEMDDFAIPNSPNYFNLPPSPDNYPLPGKRPLSSMSPSIVLNKDGSVRLIGGASGGPRIITATVQIILNCLVRGMTLEDAYKAPRVHSQLLPDLAYIENHTTVSGITIKADSDVYDALTSRGHKVESWGGSMGVAQFIEVDQDTGVMHAFSDPRKDGKPAAATS